MLVHLFIGGGKMMSFCYMDVLEGKGGRRRTLVGPE